MIAECLLDTNILVYAVDASPENRTKQRIARDLIGRVDFGTSAQVMQEFYVTVTRKLETPLPPEDALAFLDKLSIFASVPTDYGLISEAIRNSVKYQVSYWDAAVIAAAERLKAHTLYSEDLNHGQQYGSVTVINPFHDEKAQK
ncbi:PIN domain-containing protein [Ruficoccus amylovorans]|jgi:predicted nucleic acid-binding protein|uniref:Ribonuclease VapC n=1 Tax=Ruficoccus amylovorans TaxID=1804625 RepID=A0A842HBJ7_9BACT|nr:PIN domain-containing protein [Ruficoccus amylovorans]MBC2593795.1 PIN domain-containing protein [Ruficoccus amylovorans]